MMAKIRKMRAGNELRVFALRSRRKNPVGRTRGGEDLGGELCRFYAGRSVAGARVAAHRLRSDAFERQMTVRRGAFGMAVGVIWVAVTAIGGGGDSAALVACRGTRGQDQATGWEKGADHGPMAGPCGSVRMKISRPW